MKGRTQDKSLHWSFFRSRLSGLDHGMFRTSRSAQRSIARRGGISRRRDCLFADVPSPSVLKHLLKGEGDAAE